MYIGTANTVKYAKQNRTTQRQAIMNKITRYSTPEEKASYLYSFFTGDSTSKAEVAQQLADILETKYKHNAILLQSKLPKYICDAKISIRQVFGDANHAIFQSYNSKENSSVFPNRAKMMTIPDSHRFGPTIAKLCF